MTTSSGAVAHRPSSSRNGVVFAAAVSRLSKPTPKYGPSPAGLPLVPMIFASSVTSPTAAATCGTARTRSSVLAATVGLRTVQSVESTLNAVLALTTASVPSYAACVRPSAPPRIVSVSVNAPLIMATPSTMASVVRIVRTGRAISPLRATCLIGRRPP